MVDSGRMWVIVVGCAWAALGTVAQADTPLGVYVGAAGGESHVRSNQTLVGTEYDLSEHDTGWKVMVGVRPVRIFGVELEYVDFGKPGYGFGIPANAAPNVGVIRAKSEGVFGLLYAPIPLPNFDIYGKLGGARLQSSLNGTAVLLNNACVVGVIYCGSREGIAVSRTNVNVGYGAGVQFKFHALAVRAEYERISSNTGDPDLASLGLTWTF